MFALCICCTMALVNADVSGCEGNDCSYEGQAHVDTLLTFPGIALDAGNIVIEGDEEFIARRCDGCDLAPSSSFRAALI